MYYLCYFYWNFLSYNKILICYNMLFSLFFFKLSLQSILLTIFYIFIFDILYISFCFYFNLLYIYLNSDILYSNYKLLILYKFFLYVYIVNNYNIKLFYIYI